jgi:hypothetical protein
MKTIEAHSKLIDFALTEEQAALLSPLVHAATREGRNIIFMTVAPFQPEDSERVWRLHAVTLPARDGFKVIKLIRKLVDDQNPLLPNNQ